MTKSNFSWKRTRAASATVAKPLLCSIAAISLATVPSGNAQAATIVLDFEGLQNLEPINNFYNEGTGGFGSSSGKNFGIEFSSNLLGIIDEDAGGTGNFGGEPSADTIAFFLTGKAAVMNVADGFDTGFSFFYSAINRPGIVNVYDALGGAGNLLTSLALPQTPFNEAPDPTGQFSPFVPFGVNFDGIARSVDFGGTIDRIGFDNITLGSKTPGQTPTEPTPTEPTPTEPTSPLPLPPVTELPDTESVPEPGSTAALLIGLAAMSGAVVRRNHRAIAQPAPQFSAC